MKKLYTTAFGALTSVFAVLIGMFIFKAAGLPFAPGLSWGAWAQWLIFMAIIYTCVSTLRFLASAAGRTLNSGIGRRLWNAGNEP